MDLGMFCCCYGVLPLLITVLVLWVIDTSSPPRRRRTVFDPERTGRFIRFLAYAQKEIDRMNAPLPPFDLVSRCPKCGMEGGQPGSDLYGHRFMGLPVARASDPFPVEYHAPYPMSDCSVDTGGKEHLHRTCPRCNFQWAEAIPKFPDRPIPLPISLVRPEVAAFALLMERQLAAHDDRPGWKECSANYLFRRLEEKVAELRRCIPNRPLPSLVGREAADAANYCMFIADVGGALAPKEEK